MAKSAVEIAAPRRAQGKGECFAPVPARAISDERLTALDWRVLAALAAHDRFGANGIGAYASHARLAELTRCHLKSLSRSLRALAELGYIEAKRHPVMHRLRVYSVIYSPEDNACLKRPIGNETVTNGDHGKGNELVTGNEPVPSIGNRDFQVVEEFQEDADVEYITRSVEDITRSVKDNPAEAAAARQSALKKEGHARTREAKAPSSATRAAKPDVDSWRREAADVTNPDSWR